MDQSPQHFFHAYQSRLMYTRQLKSFDTSNNQPCTCLPCNISHICTVEVQAARLRDITFIGRVFEM